MTEPKMEFSSLEKFTRISASCIKDDWRKSFDSLFTALRVHFVFDNLAIYKLDHPGGVVEAVYARATGRGRSQEADASWGEEIANQVISTGTVMCSTPRKGNQSDRIAMPYLLGLPLAMTSGQGALVFVRFGGPEFSTEHSSWALLAASHVIRIFEHRALKDALDQLEQARHRYQLQEDFIATISHDLHTPLGFIKGYTTSLLRSDTSWDPATTREFLTIIDEETDQLVLLIDRILDSARLQSGNMPMDLQPVRLEALLRDVVVRQQGRHQNLNIELDLQATPPILADSVRVGQVFNNLFENALKYAPGAPIRISLKVEEKSQVVTFSDQGPGIPTEHLPYLFNRFYRVSDGSHKRGTGLGLFICKQIVQAHEGHISVKTVPGKGTSFRIELPDRQPPASAKR
jgi:signal transduction histidine kinase